VIFLFRGVKPPLRAREYLRSMVNTSHRLKTEYTSANLPPIRTKHNEGNLSAFIPSETEDLMSPYKSEIKNKIYHTKGEGDIMNTEMDTLDNQIYKLQSEILQIEEDDIGDLPKHNFDSYKKVTPLRKNHYKNGNKPTIDSNRLNALEITSNLDNTNSSPAKDSFYGLLNKSRISRESQ